MPLKFSQRNEAEVPTPSGPGKVNEDLMALKSEMSKLAPGMVLEIDTDGAQGVRSIKMLVTKAANQLGSRWRHWNVGSTVFAKPQEAVRRRGRKPKSE